MTSSEYNDNRPQDGQDEREQRLAEKERYDYETIDRFEILLRRAQDYDYVTIADVVLSESLCADVRKSLLHLLEQEGY